MYYKLIRQHPDGKAVRGTLYTVEHRFSRFAGIYKEYLTKVCETLENTDHLIPPLIYKVGVTKSPKFRRLLPVVEQVPERMGIRFHRGTKPEHSKGCILVSKADEELLTAMLLKERNRNEEPIIMITN